MFREKNAFGQWKSVYDWEESAMKAQVVGETEGGFFMGNQPADGGNMTRRSRFCRVLSGLPA